MGTHRCTCIYAYVRMYIIYGHIWLAAVHVGFSGPLPPPTDKVPPWVTLGSPLGTPWVPLGVPVGNQGGHGHSRAPQGGGDPIEGSQRGGFHGCVCVVACVCVRAYVRASRWVHVRACVRVRVCVCAGPSVVCVYRACVVCVMLVHARACGASIVRVCVRARACGRRRLPSPLGSEGRATARMLGAHLSGRAGTVGRRGCGRRCCLLLGQCWVGRLWLGRERPAARWGDSSSEPSRGWHATHKGSSVLGDQPLARGPSGESRCRPCAQSLPQTRTPCRPRLAARMHQWSTRRGARIRQPEGASQQVTEDRRLVSRRACVFAPTWRGIAPARGPPERARRNAFTC